MRVTRAAERRGRLRPREHDRGRAGAAARLEAGAEPGTSASETTTSATRAEPAATASAAPSSASMPAWGDPLTVRRPTCGQRPSAAREDREARAFGERRAGRAPPEAVDGGGLDAGGVERARTAADAARVRVSSSGAQTALTPRPPFRPHAGPIVGRGDAQRRGRGTDRADEDRAAHKGENSTVASDPRARGRAGPRSHPTVADRLCGRMRSADHVGRGYLHGPDAAAGGHLATESDGLGPPRERHSERLGKFGGRCGRRELRLIGEETLEGSERIVSAEESYGADARCMFEHGPHIGGVDGCRVELHEDFHLHGWVGIGFGVGAAGPDEHERGEEQDAA